MDSLQMVAWLDGWSSRYPADYDAKFATYAGREAYGPDDLEVGLSRLRCEPPGEASPRGPAKSR